LNFDSLKKFSPNLSERLLESPEEMIAILENALEESEPVMKPKIWLSELPENFKFKLSDLGASQLNKLIEIKGKVKKVGDIEFICLSARFQCPLCEAIFLVSQTGKVFRRPLKCLCGRK